MTPDERALSITLAIQTLHDKAAHLWHFAEYLTPDQLAYLKTLSAELQEIVRRADVVREPFSRLRERLEAAE